MALEHFIQEYPQLSSGEQAQFAETVRHLLSDGFIWREEDQDRRVYTFLMRHKDMVKDYLHVSGWELRYHERSKIFHVVHREGSHRRRISRDTTIWLLLIRLIYAEQRERMEVHITRYPTTSESALFQRYENLLGVQGARKKTSMKEALRTLQSLKLIRSSHGGSIHTNDGERVIELLPPLEVIIPEQNCAQIAERIREYQRTKPTPEEEL